MLLGLHFDAVSSSSSSYPVPVVQPGFKGKWDTQEIVGVDILGGARKLFRSIFRENR